jgi:hypothetical protein
MCHLLVWRQRPGTAKGGGASAVNHHLGRLESGHSARRETSSDENGIASGVTQDLDRVSAGAGDNQVLIGTVAFGVAGFAELSPDPNIGRFMMLLL